MDLNGIISQAVKLDQEKKYAEAAVAYRRAVQSIEKSLYIDEKLHQKAEQVWAHSKITTKPYV